MSENLRRAYRDAEDRMATLMQEMHERGELRHLQGKPISLEEDDPAWLVTRMLKQEGFSHPLLERRQEVEQQLRAADAVIDRLHSRRAQLEEARGVTSPDVAHAFNAGRRLTLEDYRALLVELNRTIRDFNLTVPMALQIAPIQIDPQMTRVEVLVPSLDPDSFGHDRTKRSWWDRLRSGRGR